MTPKEIVLVSYPKAYSEKVDGIFYIRTGTVPDTDPPCPNCGFKKSPINLTGSIGAGFSSRKAWENALSQVNYFENRNA